LNVHGYWGSGTGRAATMTKTEAKMIHHAATVLRMPDPVLLQLGKREWAVILTVDGARGVIAEAVTATSLIIAEAKK